MKREVRRALKQALIEIQDDKESYHKAYNYWWVPILNFTNARATNLKEYLRLESEYDFAVRITTYYAKRYNELNELEKRLKEVEK